MSKRRAFTAAGINEWLNELVARPESWWKDEDNQIAVLNDFQYYRKILSRQIAGQIVELFARNVGLRRERVEAIFKLTTIEDIRRAIQWPGPQPIVREDKTAELYPTEGWIAEYLHYAQGSEIPTAWNFWFAVALIGAALRRNLVVDMRTFYVYPSWYLMLIEETASAKSTCFNVAKSILRRANTVVANKGLPHKEVMIAAPSGSLGGFLEDIISKPYSVTLPDGSNESGMTEGCVVIPVDELVNLLGKSQWNPSEWVHFLTGIYGWEGETWTDRKVKAGARIIHRPAISFWGGSTLSWIKGHVTEDMFQGGFLGRFVFIKRRGDQRDIAWPHPLDPVWANSLAESLSTLMLMEPREFRFSNQPGIWEWMEDWYSKTKAVSRRWEGDPFQAYWRRKQSHLVRLVMCMAVSEGRFYGTVADCERAQSILAVEEEEMSWIFSNLGAHPDKILGDYILQLIDSKRGEPYPKGELFFKARAKVGNTFVFDRLIRTLVQSGEIITDFGPKGGERYRLKRPLTTPPSSSELEKGKLVAGVLDTRADGIVIDPKTK